MPYPPTERRSTKNKFQESLWKTAAISYLRGRSLCALLHCRSGEGLVATQWLLSLLAKPVRIDQTLSKLLKDLVSAEGIETFNLLIKSLWKWGCDWM